MHFTFVKCESKSTLPKSLIWMWWLLFLFLLAWPFLGMHDLAILYAAHPFSHLVFGYGSMVFITYWNMSLYQSSDSHMWNLYFHYNQQMHLHNLQYWKFGRAKIKKKLQVNDLSVWFIWNIKRVHKDKVNLVLYNLITNEPALLDIRSWLDVDQIFVYLIPY